MRRLTIGLLGLSLCLGACGKEDVDVIDLGYIDRHWSVTQYPSGEQVRTATKDTLTACTGKRVKTIEEDIEVYDTLIAGRDLFIADDQYPSKSVTYAKGKERYAICHDYDESGYVVEQVEAFPNYVNEDNATVVPVVPTIQSAKLDVPATRQSDYGGTLRVSDTDGYTLGPALLGELAVVIRSESEEGTSDYHIPIHEFNVTGESVDPTQLMLYQDDTRNEPTLVHSFKNEAATELPLITLGNLDAPVTYDDVDVTSHALDSKLVPNELYPLYSISYRVGEKVEKRDLFVRYVDPTFIQDGVDATLTNETGEPLFNRGPLIYLHDRPLDGEHELPFPKVVRAYGTDYEPLLEAIEAAEVVDRRGEEELYRYLTIMDGWQAQEFEVTFKQRSKKRDIFLTDPKRDVTFKLTSKGAETFVEFFPLLKAK